MKAIDKVINKEALYEDEQELKQRKYECVKMNCLKVIADLYLKGDVSHPHLKQCVVFTRSLSWNPYIRDTYDSTAVPGVWKKVH